MPRVVADVDTLQQYVAGVMDRADHHAPNVDEIALAVAGGIVWRKDADQEIEVFEREGEMKNVLWVRIGGRRCAVSYNHDAGAIEFRQSTTQGTVLGSFSNATPIADVRAFFESL